MKRSVPYSVNKQEEALLREATGGGEPRLCLLTRTRVDAGAWFRLARLWLVIAGGDLILLAAGPRRYLRCVPLSRCLGSQYCHEMGELAIKSEEDLKCDRVALSPSEALRVLAEIAAWKERCGRTDPGEPSAMSG